MTRFPVLMYHAVSSSSRGRREFGIEPGLLREQLAALISSGYELMGLSEALDAVTRTPTRRVVALTFDDAYTNFHASAMPILEDARVGATLYVPTMYIGCPARWLGREAARLPCVMSWAQLKDCAAADNIEIGSHSHSHPHLDAIPRDAVTREVRESKQILESKLEREVRSFCYPHGYHSTAVRSEVRRAGYDNACEVGRRLQSAERRLSISRLAVGSSHTPQRLLDEVRCGGPVVLPYVKRRLQPAWRMVRLQSTRIGVAR